jgi:uncharacterized protein (UPF0333 family)
MRNWKVIGIVSAAILAAAVMASAYAPISAPSVAVLSKTAHMTYAPAHKNVLHTRVAQSCIAHNGTCVINGTPCCNATDSCKGPFPNTTCQ